jgi:hypothetical protein
LRAYSLSQPIAKLGLTITYRTSSDISYAAMPQTS